MLPLFPGVPGGPELLVVLLLAVALFGLPVVIALLGWRHLKGGRVEELEARIEELEDDIEAVGDDERESDDDVNVGVDVDTERPDDDRRA